MRPLVPVLAFVPLLVGPVVLAPPAEAHVRSTKVLVDAVSHGRDVAVDVDVEFEILARYLGLPAPGERDAGTVEPPTTPASSTLDGAAPAAGTYLGSRLRLSRGSVLCEPGPQSRYDLAESSDASRVHLALNYACTGAGALRVSTDIFSARDAVVDDTITILTYDVDGSRGTQVLTAGQPQVTIGTTRLVDQGGRFLVLGFEHLVTGLDHLLFLLALLLGARRLRDVVSVATAFTCAHSVTLMLGALGWVQAPAWLVEPLIALSIAFVALENLLDPRARTRLPVVFGFGLLHGLGFAGSLTIDSALSWPLLASLLSFNVGIELAQVALIAVAFPGLLLLRRLATNAPGAVSGTGAVNGTGGVNPAGAINPAGACNATASRAITVGTAVATVGVAVTGLFWFVERVPLLS
jgi:hydrogenase/urease accessory protein HupE